MAMSDNALTPPVSPAAGESGEGGWQKIGDCPHFQCGGRSYWQQEWERQAREILDKMCKGGCCDGLGSALSLLGQSLHELQDGFSHCALHRAATPIDHCPWLCLVPPFTFSPECWKSEPNPNWWPRKGDNGEDIWPPDDESLWPDAARMARKATIEFLSGIMADYPCIFSCCGKLQQDAAGGQK
jgi:hypothetical protein